MTDREKAIVMAYTGVAMLKGDKFNIFHEYIEQILGRPVWTHELGDEAVWNEIKEKSKDDFIEICRTEDKRVERPRGHWIEESSETGALSIKYTWFRCSQCGWSNSLVIPKNFCPNCGAEMRGE